MTTIVTRVTTQPDNTPPQNTPLSSAQIDQNFINLNVNKLETSWTGNTTIVTLGTITTGVWHGTTIGTAYGGTGVTTTPALGQLLIGNGSGYTVATLTGTVNRVLVSNGAGSITLSIPQDISTGSNLQFASLGIGTNATGTNGEIVATGNITSWYSDERLKENIEIIPNALEKVMTLRGVTFNANEVAESFGYINKDKQVGVIAGDVEKVLPEAVKPAPFDILKNEDGLEISKSGEYYKTVQYEKLVPLLIEAIKELNNQVNELKGIK